MRHCRILAQGWLSLTCVAGVSIAAVVISCQIVLLGMGMARSYCVGYCAAYFLIALVRGAGCVRTEVDHQLEHFSAPAAQLDVAAQQDQSRTDTAAQQEAIKIFAESLRYLNRSAEDILR